MPPTATTLTGGGGSHILFEHPGEQVPCSTGRLAEHVDVRGDGGYIVLPPSVHDNGRPYRWLYDLNKAGLAPAPDWLLELARGRRNGGSPAGAGPVGETIPAGRRNSELASLAGTLRRLGMGEQEIAGALLGVNRGRCRPPLAEDEVRAIAASIARYEPGECSPCADLGLDDIGNAARFAGQHGDVVRYVPAWGRWLRWDGRRWADDDVLEHLTRAKLTARALAEEAAREPDEQRRKDLLAHARRSSSEPRLRALLAIATADERIVVRPCDLDADAWLINAQNGTVDLRTGQLRAHDPGDRLTMLAGAAYEPEAQAPLWQAHLRRCLVSEEMIEFLQRLAGLSAIGLVREHVLPILWGSGGNGKSKTRDAIAGALGDYAHQSTIDLLMQGRRSIGQATPELADLRGRRLVTVAETAEDGRLASERVKAITGGESITARRLHGNPFTFEPSHTIWLATNHKPRIPDESAAIWRRVLLIPFTVEIPEAERDDAIGEKLARERAGILAWIVAGACAYLREGLNPPPAVRTATAAYREQEDTFSAFLAERTIIENGASALAAALLVAYTAWADRVGAPGLSRNALAEKLAARGFERARERTGSRWHGLRLIEDGTLDV